MTPPHDREHDVDDDSRWRARLQVSPVDASVRDRQIAHALLARDEPARPEGAADPEGGPVRRWSPRLVLGAAAAAGILLVAGLFAARQDGSGRSYDATAAGNAAADTTSVASTTAAGGAGAAGSASTFAADAASPARDLGTQPSLDAALDAARRAANDDLARTAATKAAPNGPTVAGPVDRCPVAGLRYRAEVGARTVLVVVGPERIDVLDPTTCVIELRAGR